MLDTHDRRLRDAKRNPLATPPEGRRKSSLDFIRGSTTRPWESPTPVNPAMTAASNVANTEDRLRAQGVAIQPPQKSWWESGLEHLARPGAAVRGAIDASRKSTDVLAGLSKGWNEPNSVPTGQDYLRDLSTQRVPVLSGSAEFLNRSGFGRFVGGAAIDMATDPTTYLTFGASGPAKALGAAGAVERRLKFAGQAISPNLNPLLRGASAVADYIPPVRAARNAIGKTFDTMHIDRAIQGVPRTDLTKGIEAVNQGIRQIPIEETRAIKTAAREFPGVGPTAASTATHGIESLPGMVPVTAKGYTRVFAPAKGQVVFGDQAAATARAGTKPDVHYVDVPNSIMTILKSRANPTTGAMTLGPSMVSQQKPIAQAVVRNKTLAESHAAINATAHPPEVKTAMHLATDSFNADAQRYLAQTGNNFDLVDNYVMHQYKNPEAYVRPVFDRFRQLQQKSRVIIAGKPTYTYPRAYPTIAEAMQIAATMGIKLEPVEDLRALVGAHRAMTEKAIITDNIGKQLVGIGGNVVSKTPPPAAGWQPIDGMPVLKGYFAHPEVAARLRNLMPVVDNAPEGIRLIRDAHQSFMKYFKGLALLTGGFHIRNAVGNIYLNIADGMWNPARYAQSAAMMSGKLKQVELAGTVRSTDEVWRNFQNFGLEGQGIFHEAEGGAAYAKSAARELQQVDRGTLRNVMANSVPNRANPLAPIDTALSASREVGQKMDTYSRLANYLHHLDLGEDYATAARSVRNALFDYSQLTDSERLVRNYIVPFYPWLRYNLPKQVELLATKPRMATGTEHVRTNAVQSVGVDESNTPAWLKESGAIPFADAGGGNTNYATLNLPLYDLQFIHDPSNIQAWAKTLSMNVSPTLGMLPQLAMNKIAYSGTDITSTPDIPGEAQHDYLMFILSQLGGGAGRTFVAASREADRVQKQAVKEGRSQTGTPEIPKFPGGAFLPVNTQNATLNANSAVYDRQRILQQQQKVFEQKTGKPLPTTDQLKREKVKSSLDALAAYSGKTPTKVAAPPVAGRAQSSLNVLNGPKVNQGDVRSQVRAQATYAGIDAALAEAVAQMESGFNSQAVGDNGHSFGLFQENDRGRGAGRAPDYDVAGQTSRFADDVKRLLKTGYRGTPGEIAAAVQRPADPVGYARKVDAIYKSLKG